MHIKLLDRLGYPIGKGRRISGSSFQCELIFSEDLPLQEARHAKLSKLSDGEVVHTCLRLLAADGSWRCTELEGTVATRTADGAPDAIFCQFRDASRQTAMESHVHQTQKMEALGLLGGGIAHDFNNLMTGIIGYSSLAESELSADDPLMESVRTIREASERAAALTRQLLGFARGGERGGERETLQFDMHVLIKEFIVLLKCGIASSIQLTLSLEAPQAFVEGDPGQLQQVLFNLDLNAREAMPGGGTMTISTQVADLKRENLVTGSVLDPGEYLVSSVEDTGRGIPREIIDRVFEPFFTTKERASGRGMGLSVAYGIIRNHGGEIRAEGQPGQGAALHVYLPLVREAADALTQSEESELVQGSGCILLADDEEMIRNLASMLLKRLGYKVITAEDGKKAVEIYQVLGHQIQLVVLDMVMPGMSGRDAFLAMRKINPEVIAILSTGYVNDEIAHRLIREGVVDFIQKPYKLANLSRIVESAMSRETKRTGST